MKKKITATKHIVFQTGKASSELVEMHPLKILLYTIGSFVLSLLMQYFKWVFRLDGSIFGFGLNLISIGFVICAFIMIIHLISRVTSRRTKDSAPKQPIKPDLPRKKTSIFEAADPEYTKRLDILRKLYSEMTSRQESISGFLQEYFSGSIISINRYESVMNDASKVLWNNYQKASTAVSMFGSAQATADRLAILDGYVNDSKQTVDKMETIIDELIKIQQQRSFSDYENLDGMLTSLARTTSRYK